MEQASFQFTDVAPRVLRSDGDSGGLRDSVVSVVDRLCKEEVAPILIKAWLPLKREHKITRSRSAVGQRTVKFLRERIHRKNGPEVLVQVFRGKSGWSRGEWIARGLTDIDDARRHA